MKKLIIVILTLLVVIACDIDSKKDSKPDPIINPGDTPDNPITRIESCQLTIAAWVELLNEIEADGKYVDLDLSACTRGNQTSGGGLWADGSFYPDPHIPSYEKGKNKIVSLVLPETATNIPDVYLYTDLTGEHYSIPFRYFTSLKNVTGINIDTIGHNAFKDLGTGKGTSLISGDTVVIGNGILTNIDFPNVTKINMYAFLSCYSLTNANIPKVKIIETQAFKYTQKLQSLYIPDVAFIGYDVLTSLNEITFGEIAPCLNPGVVRTGLEPKTITIYVPQGATGYGDIPNLYIGRDTTKNWANAFRGMGWNPSNANKTIGGVSYDAEGYGSTESINTLIILKIEYIP